MTSASASSSTPPRSAVAVAPSLEPTPLPDVYRVRHAQGLKLDVANLKGQPVADGYVSWEDAAARGVPRQKWDELVAAELDPKERLDRIIKLFATYAHRAPVTLRLGDRDIVASPERARKLETALRVIREGVEGAREQGLRIAYPVLVDGKYVAAPRAEGVFVVDPARYRARLTMTDDEARWLFDSLAQKSERVWSNGRWHYMTPELKRSCDEQVREMATELRAARAAGKRTVYLSTFISSGDPKINREIAAFVEKRLSEHPGFAGDIYVLNPALRQLVPGAKGDDYMYMWEQLLRLNLFDAARFTSSKDTLAYFASVGERVPVAYLYAYGDVMHSVGCRRELAIFADVNRQIAEAGGAFHQVPLYYGEEPMPPSLLAMEAHNGSYEARGEHPDA